ncbi:hypothetical protein IV500_06530 [Paeniglutamicibacter antarcticus]|uniref:Uncharacterized protein n=1 Tax=Arthrobacter terrae TaxID=2935737 RepID=A0A931CPB8_9MICC|nr:hypothetical protein [Arthrobacter terrae]MBG0739054.1 hypothetical protein [Arthrobacter terrae]
MSVAVPTSDSSDTLGSPRPPSTVRTRAGHTRITAGALIRTITAVTAEAFSIPVADVKASVGDDGGRLRIDLRLPIVLPSFTEAARRPDLVRAGGGTMYDRADAGRSAVAARVRELTGSAVGRIDIRLTGLRQEGQAKVR